MVCVDASLVLAWLLPEEWSEKAIRLRERWRSAGERFIAPNILLYEVSSTLRRAVYLKRVPADLCDEALESFKLFPIETRDARPLMDRAWHWGRQLNAPRLYDMYYLALADSEICDLWTADRRLARLAGGRFQGLHWIGEEIPL